jgi:hypothetical protein
MQYYQYSLTYSWKLWGLYYKTFYGRNLQIFSNKPGLFVAGKPFQASLMFVGEARSLP